CLHAGSSFSSVDPPYAPVSETGTTSFRNPAGIAMRLRNFAKQDPDLPAGRNAGLRKGGMIDRIVWEEFVNNRARLEAEVSRIRRSAFMGALRTTTRSSHGPMPAFGVRSGLTVDGATGVYLLLIDGPLATLAPSTAIQDGFKLVKLGRTMDLERRIAELSSGLPPSSLIRYLPLGMRMFPSGGEAHSFERRLLDICDAEGWALGGEFAYAPLDRIKSALASERP
ncbi:GIY-YIG nuclease family protein, partial [Paracoccus denitrificans]|uniref:GIY-YIG nuclease family protein n=1 Tax=Paracoccus denitrificans TaxID=266 RepID=UPI001F3609D3